MTDLTTLAAVKQYLGVTDTVDDAVLSSLITSYSQWFRSLANRDFDVRAYDIWRSGRDFTQLQTPQWPIVSVQGLTINGRTISAQTAFGAYGYRFTERSIVLDGTSFAYGEENIRIQYTAGYATIPTDLAQAVNELVGLRYRLRDKLEWTSKTLAGETVALSQRDMPASVAACLRQYTNPVPL